MKKYIHYCWFGNKPLSKLSKQCIKSWKKYLPDYEIICWNETNCNLNDCAFVKGAYENGKWAFVADYFRTKALNEYGGIYFDTDMKLTKYISKLLNDETFLGVEYGNSVAVGVWYEKNKNSYLTKSLLKNYRSYKKFDVNKIRDYAIPLLITDILKNVGFDQNYVTDIQKLKYDIKIYPRDYFYPLSDDHKNNIFSDNTCMIHYYDASWIPKSEYIRLKFERIFGKKIGNSLLDFLVKIKHFVSK